MRQQTNLATHPLRRWLKKNNVSADVLARRAGLKGRASIYRILRTGRCLPSTAARIEMATGGEVRALELLFGDSTCWRLVHAPGHRALLVQAVA